MFNRRQFAGTLAAVCAPALTSGAAQSRKKIALLATEVYEHSHAQHFLDRFSMGYAMGGRWREPQADLAAVYIDQFHSRDIGKQRLAKYGLRQSSNIAEALTRGGSTLAVDGVVIIAEHGKYPRNEKGQTLYPRYQWFKEVVSVFEQCGRSVPVFNDKHLSTSWSQCNEMVADAKRLNFPFYAGSSLPVTWRSPSIEMPYDTPLAESVCVAYGGIDSYDFHALETAQCMSERRQGGEVGIKSVHAVTGQQLWSMLEKRDITRKLFISALCRSHSLPVQSGYPTARVDFEWARRSLPEITGYFLEHVDGFRTAVFLTNIRDFNYAGMRADNGQIIGCQMMLPMPGRNATTADFFNPLTSHVEQMIIRGQTSYPIERTLLTSGMVIGGVDSLFAGEQLIDTPEMNIAYRAAKESAYWRT
jgi:hypothetical protein